MATESFAHATQAKYETQDASSRGLLVFFISMGCALLLIGLLLAWLFGFLAKKTRSAPFISQPFTNVRPSPRGPLLQPQPSLDAEEYMKSQEQVLQSYGWIDRQHGVVHIPIDQAMQLILKQNLPTRATPVTPTPKSASDAKTPSQGSSPQEVQR